MPAATAKMPGETVRALVSLWLLFHLLGITLAMATNTDMGRSQLLERVKRAPFLQQYLYALWLDVAYGNRLTGGELDGNRSIETELVYADGRREIKPLQPEDARGERMARYQAFARRASPPADVEEVDSTPFAFVGGSLLKQLKDEGVKEVVFRIRRHNPLSMTDAAAGVPDTRFTDMVTVSVKLNSRDEPQAQVLGQAARDVAPVTGPRSNSSGRKPSTQNQGGVGNGSGGTEAAPAPPGEKSSAAPASPPNATPMLPGMTRGGNPESSQ